jgi:predicted metal-binding protein
MSLEEVSMKIAILINEDTALRCTASGCLKAFFGRKDAFSMYGSEVEITGFTHVGGDLDKKIERFEKNGVCKIHLSSCLRSKYDGYETLFNRLSKKFEVVGYTHGHPDGKKGVCQLEPIKKP